VPLLTKKPDPIALEPRAEWARWAALLHRWGLRGFAATLLESGGAFSTLAAQSLYISQPLLDTWLPRRGLHSLAQTLEDPQQSAAFAAYLRGVSQ
jgi:hypothetical protein